MMRQITEDASEVYRVVCVTSYTDGTQRKDYFGPYPSIASAKGARVVLRGRQPRPDLGETERAFEFERSITVWEPLP